MTAFATVITAGGTSLRWLDVGTSLGRYERVSGAIGSLVASILDDLETAIPLLQPVIVTWDNSPQVDISASPVPPQRGQNPLSALVAVRWRESRKIGRATRTADLWRFSGVLSVSFIAPLHRGDGAIYEACDYLADELRALTSGEIEFRTPSVSDGLAEIGFGLETARGGLGAGYFARTVEIPFDVDEENDRLANVAPAGIPVAFEDAALVVSDRFQADVADVLGIETVYDNAQFSPPDNAAWASVSVVSGATSLTSRGSATRNYRASGLVQVDIATPIYSGDGEALAIADATFDAFHAVSDRGVTFKNPAIVSSGRNGPHWRVVVRIPFDVEALQ